jgi:gas vesicle protein
MSNEQNNQSNINAKDFIIGSLVGGIVGAATALFLAPKSGKELRTDLNDQAIVLKDKSTELASRAKESSQTLAKTVQDQSSQVAGKVRDISGRIRKEEGLVSSPEAIEQEYNEGKAEALKDAMQPEVDENTTSEESDSAVINKGKSDEEIKHF